MLRSIQPILLVDTDWTEPEVDALVADALDLIKRQCAITMTLLPVITTPTPGVDDAIDEIEQAYLLDSLRIRNIAVVFINRANDTHQAYSYVANAPVRSRGTAWITRKVLPSCRARTIAHELGHILLDQSVHDPDRRNLMHGSCAASNFLGTQKGTKIRRHQCQRIANSLAQ